MCGRVSAQPARRGAHRSAPQSASRCASAGNRETRCSASAASTCGRDESEDDTGAAEPLSSAYLESQAVRSGRDGRAEERAEQLRYNLRTAAMIAHQHAPKGLMVMRLECPNDVARLCRGFVEEESFEPPCGFEPMSEGL